MPNPIYGAVFAVAIIFATVPREAHSQGPAARPVLVGGDANNDACGTFAEVTGLNPRGDGFLSVRNGPSVANTEIDRLFNGDYVSICSIVGDWLAVVYRGGRRDQTPCGVQRVIPHRQVYAGPCKSGWIHKRFVRGVAG